MPSDLRLVVVGQVVGQLALVGITPILTRTYGASSLGLYQTVLGVAVVLQPAATLRLETQIAVTNDGALFRFRHRLGLMACLGASLLTLVLAALVAHLRHQGDSVWLGTMYGATVLVYGWIAVDNAALLRAGRLRALAIRNALGGIIGAVLQLAFSAGWRTDGALVAGLVIGRMVAVAVTSVRRRGRDSADHVRGDDSPYTWTRAGASIASGVVSNTAVQSLLFVTVGLFGSSLAGQVGVAQRIAGTPTTLLGQGLSQAVLAKAAPAIRRGDGTVRESVRRPLRLLWVGAILIAIGGMALGRPLAPLVLGRGWETAGTLVAVLALPLALQLPLVPASNLFAPIRREVALFWLQVARLAFTFGAIGIAYLAWRSFLPTMVAASVGWTLSYVCIALAYEKYVGEFDRRALAQEGTDDEIDSHTRQSK